MGNYYPMKFFFIFSCIHDKIKLALCIYSTNFETELKTFIHTTHKQTTNKHLKRKMFIKNT